jgi:hypothetical protein
MTDITDTTDDHDVSFAAAAFAAALPPVPFRPDQRRAPHRHRRAPAALAATATAATVAVVATVVMGGGGGTQAAWSATPRTLSSSASSKLDQACRAATPLAMPPGPGASATSGASSHADEGDSGHFSSGGGGVVGQANGSITSSAGPPQSHAIGDLPLILVDDRGSAALALYGNADHHIICTLDPTGRAMLTPDAGSWPTGHLLDAAATLGQSYDNGTSTAAEVQMLGTTESDVVAMTVDVPGVGTVHATVHSGYYALFVPHDMLGNTTATNWSAHVTTSDGTVHDTTVAAINVTAGPGGRTSVRVGRPAN